MAFKWQPRDGSHIRHFINPAGAFQLLEILTAKRLASDLRRSNRMDLDKSMSYISRAESRNN
jgi:hypothetical protein